MFAAHAALEVGPLAAAVVHAVFNKFADTLHVDGLERIGIQDLCSKVVTHEGSHVVAGETEGHLGEVVGTEAEELCGAGHAVGGESSTRDFDHGAEMVCDVLAEVGLNLCLDAVADCLLEAELAGGDGDRDHDFGLRMHAFLDEFGRSLEDSPVLGFGDERIGDVETHSAVTHHRVHLVEFLAAVVDFLNAHTKLLGEFGALVFSLGNEFVERRVEQAEHHRLAVHNLEGALHTGLHEGQEFVKGSTALFLGLGEDHAAKLHQRHFAVAAVEHMLDTEQADTFGAELKSLLGVFRSVGVGADTEPAVFVNYAHEADEERILAGVHGFDGGGVDEAAGTVEREIVAFLINLVAATELHSLGFKVDLHGFATYDAALAPAAGHEGCVTGHTSAGGEDTGCCAHAFDVFRRSLLTDEDNILLLCCGCHCVGRSEDYGSHGSARGCGQTLCDNAGLLFGGGVEHGVKDFVELGRRHPHDCGALVDHALVEHVHRHLESGDTGALADTALEHPEVAFLNGELDILHIVEVGFQLGADGVELCVNLGHCLLEALEILVMLVLGGFVEGVRGADTCNHVFALGVDEPFSVELVVTGGRVTGECHTGGGGVAHVTEHHALHVHSGAPVIGNLFDAAVSDCTLAVPALEHAADGAPKLGLCGVGELDSENLDYLLLELLG